MPGETMSLREILEALYAYDNGALDSGIRDEKLRRLVLHYLAEQTDEGRRWAIAVCARAYLTKSRLEQGYGLRDVVAFAQWLDDQGVDY